MLFLKITKVTFLPYIIIENNLKNKDIIGISDTLLSLF